MAATARPSEVAARQSELRSLNEASTAAGLNGDDAAVTILCECGRSDCETSLSLSRDLYQTIRQHAGQSIVLTGHETPEISRLVQHRGTISIVESTYIGNGAVAAVETTGRPAGATGRDSRQRVR